LEPSSCRGRQAIGVQVLGSVGGSVTASLDRASSVKETHPDLQSHRLCGLNGVPPNPEDTELIR
jgi:hypothetical protein